MDLNKNDTSLAKEKNHTPLLTVRSTQVWSQRWPPASEPARFQMLAGAFRSIFPRPVHMKMFVNGFKVTSGIVWIQKFQSHSAKPYRHCTLEIGATGIWCGMVLSARGKRRARRELGCATRADLVSVHP